MIRTSLATLAVLAAAAPAAQAATQVAPGRVVVPFAGTVPVRNVDATGALAAAALPDGGVVMAAERGTPTLLQLTPDGKPDPAFGTAGIARPAVPDFSTTQVLRRPDGRLLLVGVTRSAALGQFARLQAVGLTANGALDPSFGSGGIARLDLQASCGSCAPAALAPDGGLVLTGGTGGAAPDAGTNPTADVDRRWVVTRLTSAGTVDPSFGTAGLVTVSGPGDAPGGFGVGVTAAGRIPVLGRTQEGLRLAALTPNGAPDPTWNGGAPVAVPTPNALNLLVDPTGRVDVVGPNRLTRFTPLGAPDAGFGEGGSISYPQISGGFSPQVLPAAGGGLLVASRSTYDGRGSGTPALLVRSVSPAGVVDPTPTAVTPGFGGGFASRQGSTALGMGRGQDSFAPGTILPRPGGGFVLAGGVRVVRYTGEGSGFSTGQFAAAALTADLKPDPSYGGAATQARLSMAVPAQRASSDRELRRVLVRVTTRGPGLALVRVRDGKRRILAQSLEPVYAAGTTTVRVPLTAAGRSGLRSGMRVTVGHAFRDLLRSDVNDELVARLR